MATKRVSRICLSCAVLLCPLGSLCFADVVAQLQQAETLTEAGQYRQAEQIYQQVAADYPGTDYAFAAQKGLANSQKYAVSSIRINWRNCDPRYQHQRPAKEKGELAAANSSICGLNARPEHGTVPNGGGCYVDVQMRESVHAANWSGKDKEVKNKIPRLQK